MQASVRLAERAAPFVEVFQQAALRAHPYATAIAGQLAAWEALIAPALLRVAPLLERAYAAAQNLQALAESRTHQACFRAAEAVDVNDKNAVIRFTVEVLRLHPDLWPVAAEVLAPTNDWWWATDPIQHLRREVRANAGRIGWADRDHRRRTVPFGEAEVWADPNGGFARQQVEVVHDVTAAFSRTGLRTETSLVLAALEDHDRVSAARVLKVSIQEVDTGWKRVQRKRGELARLLKP